MIALMPLMNIPFPANTILLFKLLAFLNGDIFIFEKAYDYTVGAMLPFPEEPHPYNPQF